MIRRWLRRMLRSDHPLLALARLEHIRALRKAARWLPGDEAIREEIRRAEEAMRSARLDA